MSTTWSSRPTRWLSILPPLLIGAILRIALWNRLPRQGFISDEAEYLASANWLALGRGFTWHQGWFWTRAPLYPLFLATHLWLFGTATLTPIFLTQSLFSMGIIVLIYGLTLQSGGGRRAAGLAAMVAAIYFPFATHAQMLLSETLHLTIILGAWVMLGQWAHDPQRWWYVAYAGILLGLATLTRALTIGLLPLVACWMFLTTHSSPETQSIRTTHHPHSWSGWCCSHPVLARALPVVILVVMASAVILPWSYYASRVYGGTIVVDTTGAFNLLCGARAAYDGERQDAPVRQFLSALLDETLSRSERLSMAAGSCLFQRRDHHLLAALERPVTAITQGERQRLMYAEAFCLLRATPLAFLEKSFREFVNLLQINYTSDERMSSGFALGYLPHWYILSLFVLNDTIYVFSLPLGILGWALTWRERPTSGRTPARMIAGITGIWWCYLLCTIPLTFAIDRFRLLFLPFVFMYAAIALVQLGRKGFSLIGSLTARYPEHGIRAGRITIIPQTLIQQVRPYLGPSLLSLLLFWLALAPHAYFQSPPASLASYLGPYPSSLAATRIAWNSRAAGLDNQALIAALGRGDAATVRALLTTGKITSHTRTYALPLLAALEGKPAIGLVLLDLRTWYSRITGVLHGTLPGEALVFLPPPVRNDWRAAVVRGELLRRQGDVRGTKAAFTPSFVDDNNPVEWAWEWLHPPPTRHIDLAGNTDLGYIWGFYLGESDPAINGTFRWSGSEARLLFPRQGRAEPQELCLRADGRGWPLDIPLPQVQWFLGNDKQQRSSLIPIGTLELERAVTIWCRALPPTPPGADIMVVLRSPTFVPPAADLRHQQGPQTGQLRQLGVRLDWVELRP